MLFVFLVADDAAESSLDEYSDEDDAGYCRIKQQGM